MAINNRDLIMLKELFKPEAVLNIQKVDKNYTVTLNESQQKDSNITIKNLPSDTFIIAVPAVTKSKSNSSPDSKSVFQSSDDKQCNNRCDFILMSAEEKCIVFIEYKTAEKIIKILIISILWLN